MEGEVGGGRVVSLMSSRGCLSADGGLVWAECCGGWEEDECAGWI